jgi:pimeloyl-ACP methyl ester carboxylesterase
MLRLLLCGFVAICLSAPTSIAAASDGPVGIEAFTLRTFDGQAHAVELGRITVLENRHSTSKRSIQVAFVRLPHRGPQPGAPIFFLPPGPGIPATVLGRVPVYFRLLDKLRDIGDVLLIDIRGEGMSSPNFDDCPATTAVSPRALESLPSYVEQVAASVSSCAAFWRSKGADLSAYSNQEIVDDINELRRGLGYQRISLLGFSAGTDLGMEFLRRHGDVVERAAFAGVGAAELRPNLPSTYDRQLQKIAYWYRTSRSDGSDLVAMFEEDAKALDANPVILTLREPKEGREVRVRVGSVALRVIVTDLLSGSLSLLPALLRSVHEQDYSLLQILVQKSFISFYGSMTLIGRTIGCSAPIPVDRAARVQQEAQASRFGNVRNIHLEPPVCRAAIGRALKPHPDRDALFSTVPTLFVSGSMDANTPPFNAESLLWGFPNGIHVIVKNAFHETLPIPAVQGVVVDFFNGQKVGNRDLSVDIPPFLSLEEARTAAQRGR